LSGRKQARKNYFRNGAANQRAVILRSLYTGLKISTGIAALLLISFVFIFGYDFLTQCDYFNAEHLTVAGSSRLSKARVLKQARLKKGMNILSVNLSTVRKRLLADSWIAEAEVSREFPTKIHIRIKEHTPLATIDLGRKFLINTQGKIFKEVAASESDNLPIIKGLEFSDINAAGESRSLPFEAAMNVLALGQNPESVLPNNRIKTIQVDRDIGLTIYAPDIASGRFNAIKIGFHDYPRKLAGLKNVLLYLKKDQELLQLDFIDLNKLNRIVVQPAKIESPAGDQKEV
jgi:cell division protein FtsQ